MCGDCPWGQEIPEEVSELFRLCQLLRMGVTVPIGRFSRWEEDALLIVQDEIETQRAERAKKKDGE